MRTMMHEQSGLPSYDERTPLVTNEDIKELETRLAALKEDPRTGLFDTREIDTSLDLLSAKEKAIQIERVKNLIRSKYPNVKFDNLVIGFSKKNNGYCSFWAKRWRD